MSNKKLELYVEIDGSGLYGIVKDDEEPLFYIEVKARGRCAANFFVFGFTSDGKVTMYSGMDEIDWESSGIDETLDLLIKIYKGECRPCALRCKKYNPKPETIKKKLRERIDTIKQRLEKLELSKEAEKVIN